MKRAASVVALVLALNASDGTAHVSFAGNDAIQFLVGRGDSKVKFDKPGTYGVHGARVGDDQASCSHRHGRREIVRAGGRDATISDS